MEVNKNNGFKAGSENYSYSHGKSYSKIYYTWSAMKRRCLDEKNPRWHQYGARGITICERWLKFENFFEDMGDPPTKKHSIDRIDNDLGYFKENCRWATLSQQNSNRRFRIPSTGCQGILRPHKSFIVKIRKKHFGSFKNLEDAKVISNDILSILKIFQLLKRV